MMKLFHLLHVFVLTKNFSEFVKSSFRVEEGRKLLRFGSKKCVITAQTREKKAKLIQFIYKLQDETNLKALLSRRHKKTQKEE